MENKKLETGFQWYDFEMKGLLFLVMDEIQKMEGCEDIANHLSFAIDCLDYDEVTDRVLQGIIGKIENEITDKILEEKDNMLLCACGDVLELAGRLAADN